MNGTRLTLCIGLGISFLGVLSLQALTAKTHASFTDTEHHRIEGRALNQDNVLRLSPGSATISGNSDGVPNKWRTIASLVNGDLILDFGYITYAYSGNVKDVFRITNLSGEAVTINLELTPEIMVFVKSALVGKSNTATLEPGEQVSVDLNLKQTPDLPIGRHSGSLLVTALNDYISFRVPAVMEIVHPDEEQSTQTSDPETPIDSSTSDTSDPPENQRDNAMNDAAPKLDDSF